MNVGRAPTAFARVCGLAAFGFAAIILLGNALILVPAGLPTTGADLGDVTAFFRDEGDAVALASVFLPATWALATLFGAGAVAAARHAEHRRGKAWALVGLAGVVLQNGTITAVSAIRLALAHTDAEAGARGLWAVHDALFTLNGTFLALALVGLSTSGLRAGLLPTWHAGLGYTAAALQFTSATLTPLVIEHGGALGLVGLAGWLLWVAWLVRYGLALLKTPSPDGPSARER